MEKIKLDDENCRQLPGLSLDGKMDFLYKRTVKGTADEIGKRLEEKIKAHQFGILGIIDLQGRMREKGVVFDRTCRIYEICKPSQAKRALEKEILAAAALPCRIALYQDGNDVGLGTMKPARILDLFGVPGLSEVAREIEAEILMIMDETAFTP